MYDKIKSEMNITNALAIMRDIKKSEETDRTKIKAIIRVLNMPTHNSVTKEMLMNSLEFLLNLIHEREKLYGL